MIKNLFIKNCGEKNFKSDFSKIYETALQQYETEGVYFLEEEYIRSTNEECGACPRILESVLNEAERIKENRELSVYALFIDLAMQNRELYRKNIKHFEVPV